MDYVHLLMILLIQLVLIEEKKNIFQMIFEFQYEIFIPNIPFVPVTETLKFVFVPDNILSAV